MRFAIRHEMKGRIRIHILQKRMSFEEADRLQYFLSMQPCVKAVKVREKTMDASVSYQGSREELISILREFRYDRVEVPEAYLQNSGRELNEHYKEKLINKVLMRAGSNLFLPPQVRAGIAVIKSAKYIWHGLETLVKGKLEVPVLDATAIGVSLARGDFNTVASVMFLLGIGEILEEWTHKKSVGDLARSMSLNVSKVWLLQDGQEILVDASGIAAGDCVVVHMGNMIPFDGTVTDGEALLRRWPSSP